MTLLLSTSWIRVAVTSIMLLLLAVTAVELTGQENENWRSVSPGFSAQVLLYHDSAMWAAGSTEGIAESNDGGQHWQKKHEDRSGGLLLAFAFVNAKFGYAAGTGRNVLMTEDGGESWSARMQVPETVFQAAFGDTQHGVIRSRSALLSTTNGGKSWKPVVPANDTGWSDKFSYTNGMVALDARHLIVRVGGGEYSDGEYLWTADGGDTWSANYLPNGAGGGHLFVAQGEYWSIGGEVVGKDHPGGGLNIPMAVRSPDGVEWEHLPAYREACHWTGCGGCTSQGCFAGRSSFVPFSRILDDPSNGGAASASLQNVAKPESLNHFSEHLLSDQWARSGDTLCLLTRGTIECTTLKQVGKLDTEGDQAEWDHWAFPPLHPATNSLASSSIEPALKPGMRCIRCDLERLFITNIGNSGPVAMQISFMIETNGQVGRVVVSGPVPEDVAAKLRNAASGWLFEPFLENGVPKTVPIKLRGQVFIMNPEKPQQR
jgi:hypothetical protein